MLYPFTHKILGKIDNVDFEFAPDIPPLVGASWGILPIRCPSAQAWVDTLTEMKTACMYLSGGVTSYWHIDRNKFMALAGHRILIPVTDNFVWEFKLKDGTIETVAPVIGNIYLINNMIPHRFTAEERRACIFFDLYDTKVNRPIMNDMYNEVFENYLR
jgi:hypothetical protein